MLSIVESQTQFTTEGGTAIVKASSLDSNVAHAELNSPDARKLAINFAASRGVPDPRINGTVTIYPVDAQGKVVENQLTQAIAAFHADIPITRRMV